MSYIPAIYTYGNIIRQNPRETSGILSAFGELITYNDIVFTISGSINNANILEISFDFNILEILIDFNLHEL